MKKAHVALGIAKSYVLLGLAVLAAGAIGGAILSIEKGSDIPDAVALEMVPVAVNDTPTLFVQTHEVSVTEWNRCHAAGACALQQTARARSQGRDYPATGLNFVDAMEFVAWANATSNYTFRLPTAAEWDAMAVEVLPEAPDPIFNSPELTWAATYIVGAQYTDRKLRPSGAFSTTQAGVSDLNGNVWEWTQDCYSGAGSAIKTDRCPAFILGGEHEAVVPFLTRDPARGGCAVGAPPAHLGMRLVTEDRYQGTTFGESQVES